MIYSMTGYAVRTREVGGGSLHLELKSVNSRYLDIHFRVADELRLLEPALREAIAARLARGKVELRLAFVPAQTQVRQLSLNTEILARLRVLDGEVRNALPDAAPLGVADVLRWPGILGEQGADFATLQPQCLSLLQEALEDFAATRAREGEKLGAMILDRAARMGDIVTRVAPQIPQIQTAFQEKLRQRLVDALGGVDEERLRQEVVLFATRIDVAEELSRLTAHLEEVARIIKTGGNVGKRLDFLMQELNREANTLGSKSVVSAVSDAAVDLKLLIEQMREQVQNLE